MSKYTLDSSAIGRVTDLPGVSAALDHLADDILSDAEGKAPVDTGELRGSGFTDSDGADRRIGFEAEHAPYVEMGTDDTRAQPFLAPAALRQRSVR